MGSIRGVIWDVDGTLADTLGLCVTSLQEAVERVGGPSLTTEEMKATFGPTEEGILAGLVGDRWEPAFAVYLDVYQRAHDEQALVFTDVVAQVVRLADAGVPQAVVTGKGAASAEITLRSIGVGDVFDEVAAGSPHGSIKQAEIARIVEMWSLDAAEVVYIGDHASDVTHARAAGAVAVSAAWAPDTDVDEIRSEQPAAILMNSSDLAAWLEANVDVLSGTG